MKWFLVFGLVGVLSGCASSGGKEVERGPKDNCRCEEACGCKSDHPHLNSECNEQCDVWH